MDEHGKGHGRVGPAEEGFIESLLGAVETFMTSLAETSLQTTPAEEAAAANMLAATAGSIGLAAAPSDPHAGIGSIRQSDPAFDLARFLVRVGEMFSAFHEALDRGDLSPVRHFVDEATYAQLESAAEKTGRRPDGVRALRIHAIRPMTAHADSRFDVIRVLITAEQAPDSELLCEYWEVVRRLGVQTKAGLNLTDCPNCGGPVDGLDPTRCAYCGTRLADPALDWVVRKITPQ